MQTFNDKRIPIFGAVILAALILISYQPNFRIGFYLDDYVYLERAGRTDWSNALAQIFDPRGNRIAAYDSAPGKGKSPTTQWLPERNVIDAVVVPIPIDAPLSENYRLEIGLYDVETMLRFAVLDATGKRIDDKIVIEPFSIVK